MFRKHSWERKRDQYHVLSLLQLFVLVWQTLPLFFSPCIVCKELDAFDILQPSQVSSLQGTVTTRYPIDQALECVDADIMITLLDCVEEGHHNIENHHIPSCLQRIAAIVRRKFLQIQ